MASMTNVTKVGAALRVFTLCDERARAHTNAFILIATSSVFVSSALVEIFAGARAQKRRPPTSANLPSPAETRASQQP